MRTNAICSTDLTVVATHIQLLGQGRQKIAARNAKATLHAGHSHILPMMPVVSQTQFAI
jgi:hypothetical protein